MTLVTVITVVYNDREGLKKTMNSIEEQTSLGNIEYIIIDGGSNDGTKDLIKNNPLITQSISERDRGIYDAMNKGIDISTGQWIIFLNAGDAFYDKTVLAKIKDKLENVTDSINLLYGKYSSAGIVYDQTLSVNYLIAHMINHQSILYRRDLFENKRYDIKFRYCADYKHLLDNFHILTPHKLDFVISEFDNTGISSQVSNKYKMWSERLRGIWSSPFPFKTKIILSSRGVIALPYQYLRALCLK